MLTSNFHFKQPLNFLRKYFASAIFNLSFKLLILFFSLVIFCEKGGGLTFTNWQKKALFKNNKTPNNPGRSENSLLYIALHQAAHHVVQLQQLVASCFLHHGLGSHIAGSKSREDRGKHMAGPYGSGLEVSSEPQQNTANLAELLKRAHPIWSLTLNNLPCIPYTKTQIHTSMIDTSVTQQGQSGWDTEQHPERAKETIISCSFKNQLAFCQPSCVGCSRVCCISGRSWKRCCLLQIERCVWKYSLQNLYQSTQRQRQAMELGSAPIPTSLLGLGEAGSQSPYLRMD